MINNAWLPNVDQMPYSDKYFKSIQERFKEFGALSKQEVVTVLQKNEHRRIQGSGSVYEESVSQALDLLDTEIVIENNGPFQEDYLIANAFKYKEYLIEAIRYLDNHNIHGAIVFGYYTKKSEGFTQTIGSMTTEDPQMIGKGFENILQRDESDKYIVAIDARLLGKDSLGRNRYRFTPKSYQIPGTGVMLIDGSKFIKTLSYDEFDAEISKMEFSV